MSAWILAHPIFAKVLHGAVSGALAAALVDYHAFMTWKSVQDAMKYDWGTAAFRWLQGAIMGAAVGGGFGVTSA